MQPSPVATFELLALRFGFVAHTRIHFPAAKTVNLFRGQLGKIMKRREPGAYSRYFAPLAAPGAGPSGLRDSPRPFVFRASHLDGVTILPGERFHVGINLFETREPALPVFEETLTELARERFGAALETLTGRELLRVELAPRYGRLDRVRVRFLTPTELKGAETPDFGVLFARIRDRVSTLRSLYGAAPLDIDFKAIGDRAMRIRTTRCEICQVKGERWSGSSGRLHPLGGFVGIAEYQGDLGEFMPYLEVARWTGVGRQTVWGKGEIACEAF